MKYTAKLGSHSWNSTSGKHASNRQTDNSTKADATVFDDTFWTELYDDLVKKNNNSQISSTAARIDKKSLSSRASYLKSLLLAENLQTDSLNLNNNDASDVELSIEKSSRLATPSSTSTNLNDNKTAATVPVTISSNKLQAALMSDYCGGKDITKAYELLRYFDLVDRGNLVSNNGKYKNTVTTDNKIYLKGAENWGNVMCYLDALLFAMFSKIENFEPLLYSYSGLNREEEDIKITRLRAILRLYVSLLRSGELITQDITMVLCKSLEENGIVEAMSRKQEDSSQLFIDMADLLNLPLLTLKIDIAHGGKEVKEDDHKFTKERMLYVSIPGEDDVSDTNTNKNNENMSIPKSEPVGDSGTKSFKTLPKQDAQNLKPIDELIGTEHHKAYLIHQNSNLSKEDINSDNSDLKESAENQEDKPAVATTEQKENKFLEVKSGEDTYDENRSHHSDSGDDEDEFVLLEECLEHYFNNSIEVRRQLERRRATITSSQPKCDLGKGNTLVKIDTVKNNISNTFTDGTKTDVTEVNTNDDSVNYDSSFYDADDSVITSKSNKRGVVTYTDVSEPKLSIENSISTNRPLLRSSSLSKDQINVSVRSRADSVVSIFSENKNREVSLPAWMFLKLLPFYTDLEPRSKTEQGFAAKRPILPICLKRYTYIEKHSSKNNKKVVIPSFINLPRFIADEDIEEQNKTKEADKENIDKENDRNSTQSEYNGFRLILESAVCHRGKNVNCGHYVALVRDKDFDINTTEKEEDEKTWLLFDDLNVSQRVKPIKFKKAFSEEAPYILFYRMAPYEEVLNTDAGNDNSNSNKSSHLDESSIGVNLAKHFKSSEVSLISGEHSDSSHARNHSLEASDNGQITTEAHTNTIRKSHDLKSKMLLHSSTYPYPSSSEYIDIKDRFYWKLKTQYGYEEETSSMKFREHQQLTQSCSEVVKTHSSKRYSLFSSSKRHSVTSSVENVSDSTYPSDTDATTATDAKLSGNTPKKVKSPRISLDDSATPRNIIAGQRNLNYHNNVAGSDAQHHLYTVISRKSRKKKMKKDKYKKEKCVIQ